MDQTLDQIVKSRNIKFNGKIGQNKNKSQQLFQQKRQSSNNQGGFKQRKNQGFVQRRNQIQRSFGGNVQKRGQFMRQPMMQRQRQQMQGGFRNRNQQQGFFQVQMRLRPQFQQFRKQGNMINMFVNRNRNAFRPQQRQMRQQQPVRMMQQQQNVVMPSGGLQSTKLYVSNLDFGVTNQDVKELFSEFGPIVRYGINFSAGGRSVGTAEVVYKNRISAVKAMQKYNGVTLDGRPMKLEVLGGTGQQNQRPFQMQQNQNRNQMQVRGNKPMMRKMMNKPMVMKRKAVISNKIVKRAKNIMRVATTQKKTGGAGKKMKGNKAVPDVKQLDADLDAYLAKEA